MRPILTRGPAATTGAAAILLLACSALSTMSLDAASPPTQTAAIHDAIRANDLAAVKRLVDANAALANLPDKDRNTPLHLAAAGNSMPIAEYLLAKGAVVGARNAAGDTPLHSAAAAGALGTIDLLLKREAAIDAGNWQGASPLHVAIVSAKDDAARLLIDRGANLRWQDAAGRSPLHHAAFNNRMAIAEILLAKGVEVDARMQQQVTPLGLLTVATNHVNMARLLIAKGADVNARNALGATLLEMAAGRGSRALIDLLLDNGAGFDTARAKALPLLRAAAAVGSIRLFNLVVEKAGSDLFGNASDDGATMDAAIRGGSVEIVKVLLSRRIAIDTAVDVNGLTALHRAVNAGATGFVELLVSQGIDINRRTNDGRTAYNIAEARANKEAMSLLLKLGASREPQKFPTLTGPYLGQSPPGSEPKPFAPGIVFGHHSALAVSPDGQEMYWGSTSAIMMTRLQNGRWTTPAPAPFSGTSTVEFYDDVPFVSPDNKRLVFTSLRPVGAGAGGKENIWFVERTAGGWSTPKPVSPEVNGMLLHWQISVSRSGTLYFKGRSEAGNGIYFSRLVNGEYTKPVYAGPAINGEGDGICPYVAPDESYLIFSRPSANRREALLFISFKAQDGQWGAPVALDRRLRGPMAIVSPDGKYLFLGGITWAEAAFIEALRPKHLPEPKS